MKIKHTVLSIENQNYFTRNGQEVNRTIVNYLDLSELHGEDNRAERGLRILNKDVYGSFDFADFKEIPGNYNFVCRAGTNRRRNKGKPEARIVSIELLNKINIPENHGEAYLILWAKQYNYEVENKVIKGIKLIGIDPLNYVNDSDLIGYPIIEFSIPQGKLTDYKKFPGFYTLDYEEVRGRDGNALLQINKMELKAEFNTQTPTPTP